MDMTVKRVDLIDALTKKRDEIIAVYDERIAKAEAKKTAVEDVQKNMKQWHLDVAKLLRAGKIEVSGAGKLVGGTERVPEKPAVTRGRRADWVAEEAQRAVKYLEAYRDEDVEPLNAALLLLNMSADETVSVPSAEYQGLLSKRARYTNY